MKRYINWMSIRDIPPAPPRRVTITFRPLYQPLPDWVWNQSWIDGLPVRNREQ